jgi:DNA end-binding protein Ku
MAGRPYWSGQFKISLVSFGIELFPATKSEAGISFHQLDRATGQRVRHMNVIDGDKPIENSQIIKGYEYSKGEYVTLEPSEIANLRIPTKKVIEVQQFVSLDELSPSLFESPFFVIPQSKESGEAFAVVKKAMEQANKAAIGEIAFGGREHLVAIAPAPDKPFGGMMAYILRYGEELRSSENLPSPSTSQNVDKKQLSMASELIRAYTSPLNLEEFKDDYEAALHELIEAKQKHLSLPVEQASPRRAKVTNLMEALRRSVSQAKGSAAREKDKVPSAARKGPVLVKASGKKHKVA